MDNNKTREKLISLLDTLKRNLAAVSKEILKTKYKKPYDALIKDISSTVQDYIKIPVLQGVRVHRKYLTEVKELIESACRDSGLRKQISKAAFCHQDIHEIDALMLLLSEHVHQVLEEYYAAHVGWYLSEECFADPPSLPVKYNIVTDSIWTEGMWKPLQWHQSLTRSRL